MKRFARALMVAAVAGGVTMTSLAFSGMQGGGGGGARGARGGGAQVVGVEPQRQGSFVHPGFAGRQGFAHPGFAGRPGFAHPGFTGRPAFVHPGFTGRPAFVGRHGFPGRRVVVFGGPVFYGPPPVVYVSGVVALWYCQDPVGYFPTIQVCPVGWIEVTQ